MGYLSAMDFVLIGGYLLVLLGLGMYLQRRASNSIEDYFLAGKKLPWWAIGISGMGWSLDMTGTMLIVSLLYLFGPRGLFIEFRGGVPLGLVFVMAWTGKWHRRSNCMTGAEWQVYRFGNGIGGKAARIISAVAGIVFTVGMIAYLVKGAGLFISMFIPALSPIQASFILILVATIYTVMSGFYGVVYTDIFQSVLILIGAMTIAVFAVTKIGSFEEFSNLARTVTSNPEWMTSWPQVQATMPKAYEMYQSFFMFTIFLILRNIIVGFGTGNTPQYFAARSDKECGKIACLWSTLLTFRWPMMMGYAILGIFLIKDMFPNAEVLSSAAAMIHQALPDVGKAQWADMLSAIANNPGAYPDLSSGLASLLGDKWAAHLQFLSFEGTVEAERILPATLIYIIPAGIRGLVLITLLAASMSTFDSTLNLASALFTRDIYQAFVRPKASNRELLFATYLFSILLVAAGFGMGYYAKSINDVWGWITMGLLSGLAVPGILRLYWWRFNGAGFAIGTFCGMTAAVIQRLFWPDWPEQTQFIILTLTSLIFTVIGTYATAPTDRKTLEHFYLTTRPFGFWKPFKHRLAPDIQTLLNREHTHDLLSLPFIFIWMVSMYLLPMQLMIRSYRAFAITLIFFFIGIAGIYRFWYKNKFDFPENLTFQKAEQA